MQKKYAMGFIGGFNKYTIAGLPNKIEPDHSGGVFMASDTDVETVVHLDKDYSVIKAIKIEGLVQCADFAGNPFSVLHQRIHSISFINGWLLVSLTDNATVVLDTDGTILHVLEVHKREKDKVEGLNYSVRCNFKKLYNGEVLIVANSKFHGTCLAKTSAEQSEFLTAEMVESLYINDTYSFLNEGKPPLLNLKKEGAVRTIGEHIQAKANEYMMDKNPEKEHVHYVHNMRVWDTAEMEGGYLLLFLFTNMANKSTQPNKNMPYFLVKMDLKNGEVVKMVSPDDRGIFMQNLVPRFFVNAGRTLFKTMNALYEISDDLDMKKIYQIPDKSMFKKLFPVSYDAETIHFINPDKGELFGYSNQGKIEAEVDILLKSYRKQKKAFKDRQAERP